MDVGSALLLREIGDRTGLNHTAPRTEISLSVMRCRLAM